MTNEQAPRDLGAVFDKALTASLAGALINEAYFLLNQMRSDSVLDEPVAFWLIKKRAWRALIEYQEQLGMRPDELSEGNSAKTLFGIKVQETADDDSEPPIQLVTPLTPPRSG